MAFYWSCMLDVIGLAAFIFGLTLLFFVVRIIVVDKNRGIVYWALSTYLAEKDLTFYDDPMCYMEPFLCTFLRLYDWKCKHIVNPEMYRKIRPYILDRREGD